MNIVALIDFAKEISKVYISYCLNHLHFFIQIDALRIRPNVKYLLYPSKWYKKGSWEIVTEGAIMRLTRGELFLKSGQNTWCVIQLFIKSFFTIFKLHLESVLQIFRTSSSEFTHFWKFWENNSAEVCFMTEKRFTKTFVSRIS